MNHSLNWITCLNTHGFANSQNDWLGNNWLPDNLKSCISQLDNNNYYYLPWQWQGSQRYSSHFSRMSKIHQSTWQLSPRQKLLECRYQKFAGKVSVHQERSLSIWRFLQHKKKNNYIIWEKSRSFKMPDIRNFHCPNSSSNIIRSQTTTWLDHPPFSQYKIYVIFFPLQKKRVMFQYVTIPFWKRSKIRILIANKSSGFWDDKN